MGIILPYSEKLNIAPLNRIFDNKSECYKLFWFQAILTCVAAGKTDIRYEELIDEMIADAWYMVSEYHLNLGPNDTLEKTVHRVREISAAPLKNAPGSISTAMGSAAPFMWTALTRRPLPCGLIMLYGPFTTRPETVGLQCGRCKWVLS